MSLFDIISVVVLCEAEEEWRPDPNIFLCIPTSASVNPKGINTLLANGVSTFFIYDNPVFSKGPSNLPKISLTVSFLITEFLKILYQLMNY